MEYRQLGRTGVKVSPLCLGTMNFGGRTGESEAATILDRAIEAGINFIGPRTLGQLENSLAALEITLSENDQKRLDTVAPPGGMTVPFYGSDGFAWTTWGPHRYR